MNHYQTFWQSALFASNPKSAWREQARELHGIVEKILDSDRLKHDKTTTVVAAKLDNKPVIIKRYNARSHWHRVKRALRMSRARRCWNMSKVFRNAGLNIANPIMMVEKRVGPLRGDAFFVSEALRGEELLTKLPKLDAQAQSEVKLAVNEAFRLFREYRISHGDMKATNLLWVENKLYFIDLDAAQQHSRWSLTWKRCHQKDRKRFLKNWIDQPDLAQIFSGIE